MRKSRGQPAPVVEEPLWHALSSHAVLERLGSGSLGLTEAEAARSLRALANRYALAAVGLTAALQVLTLEIPPLAPVLKLEPIGSEGWLVALGLAVIPALAGQLVKTLTGAGRRRLVQGSHHG